eukprot:gene22531-27500_t
MLTFFLIGVIFHVVIFVSGFEFYHIVDQDLYLDHRHQSTHHHLLGNFSSCEEAKPFIKLSRHSFQSNYSRSRLVHERLEHSQLVQLIKDTNSFLSANSSTPVITTYIGWLEFTIYDVMLNPENNEKSQLCYDGKVHHYFSQRCNDENYRGDNINRTEFFGGNGYDFHMFSEGKVRYWSPLRDNRDGSYSVRLRIDDPSTYSIHLLLNNRKGCHFADCDTPRELCDTFKPYGPRMEYCKVENACVKVIQTWNVEILDSDKWPPFKSIQGGEVSYSLPNCSIYEMGSMNGRWIHPNYLKEHYNGSIRAFHNVLTPHPYVWQPYDCQLYWLNTAEAQDCIKDKEFILSGLSRERTNFFDLFDFQQRPIAYAKFMETDTVDNINYFTMYFAELEDKKHWNHNGQLARTTSWIMSDLTNNGLCLSPPQYQELIAKLEAEIAAAKDNTNLAHRINGTLQCVLANQHLQMAFLFTEENLWTAEVGLRSIWPGLSRNYLQQLREKCINATVVYKGASSLRSQYGSLSWQRMYQASRISLANARALRLPVLDSFIMTHPWIMDKDVYPDGLHLYSTRARFQGNWVSKTTSMIFLLQVCTANGSTTT